MESNITTKKQAKIKKIGKPKPNNTSILADEEKRVDIDLKKLSVKEKTRQLEEWQSREIANNENKTLVEQINSLRNLLESITIDSEKTILGSEPVWGQVFNETETQKIKEKIMQLIDKY